MSLSAAGASSGVYQGGVSGVQNRRLHSQMLRGGYFPHGTIDVVAGRVNICRWREVDGGCPWREATDERRASDLSHPGDITGWGLGGGKGTEGRPRLGLPGAEPPNESNQQYCMGRRSVLSECGGGGRED